MKPNLMQLWNAFLDHVQFHTLKELYSSLGGNAAQNIEMPGFGPNGNTCASRLSIAFNKGGWPINPAIAGVVGAGIIITAYIAKNVCHRQNIIFRVADFRKYLLQLLGKPVIDSTSPYDDAFRGKRGIIAFSVNWAGASGHIALWNGSNFREPAHDDYSTYVSSINSNVKTSLGEFWELL